MELGDGSSNTRDREYCVLASRWSNRDLIGVSNKKDNRIGMLNCVKDIFHEVIRATLLSECQVILFSRCVSVH